MKHSYLVILLLAISINAFAQAPAIQWQKSLGGTSSDYAYAIQQTTDGGYIVAGSSQSNDGDVSGNHGAFDYWIVKLNDTGAIQWQKSLGGNGIDEANVIQQTADGGYIVAGATTSIDGDVTGFHGGGDYWIVKLNDTGVIQWQKSLGGSNAESAYSIQQTYDGGYIVAGISSSNNGDVSGNHGGNDCWIVKLNDTGAIQWQKSLGGSSTDGAYAIQQTSDRGYIVAGFSNSDDSDVTGNHGDVDYWVVKLNDTGVIQWQKSLGGSSKEVARAIHQTIDGGYIVTGMSVSNDGDVTGNHGNDDYWVVKLNDTGAIQWQKSLGGSHDDGAYAIQQTSDGGYIVAGNGQSIDGDVTGNHGNSDFWVVKLNDTGAIQWQKSLGGSNDDFAYAIQQTSDGGYIVAGYITSNDGDVSGNHGSYDYWVVKITCGLNAGTITGPSVGFCVDSIILTDTVSGGIWTMSNGSATVSGGLVKAVFFFDEDTAIYTVSNTCGTVSAIHPLIFACEGGVKVLNDTTQISIIPNPTTGALSITGVHNTNVKIYNTLGQLIKEASNTNNLSISEFPAGLYLVRVFNEQGALIKQDKIIKE